LKIIRNTLSVSLDETKPVTITSELRKAVHVLATCWLPTAGDRPTPVGDPLLGLNRYEHRDASHYVSPNEQQLISWANNPPPGSTVAGAMRLKNIPVGTVPAIYMEAARELLEECNILNGVLRMTLSRILGCVPELLGAALIVHLHDWEQKAGNQFQQQPAATGRNAVLDSSDESSSIVGSSNGQGGLMQPAVAVRKAGFDSSDASSNDYDDPPSDYDDSSSDQEMPFTHPLNPDKRQPADADPKTGFDTSRED
jgi:hypothetical protein